MATLRAQFAQHQSARAAAYRTAIASKFVSHSSGNGHVAKRPRLLDLVSALETLPFDQFAQVLLYDPFVNANALRVNHQMSELVETAAHMPDFFKTAVQKCFPLITRIPRDMRSNEYDVVLAKYGEQIAENWLWRVLFLRLFEILFTVKITGLEATNHVLLRIRDLLTARRLVTCSDVLSEPWRIETPWYYTVSQDFIWARVQTEIVSEPGVFSGFINMKMTNQNFFALYDKMIAQGTPPTEFRVRGPSEGTHHALLNTNGEPVLSVDAEFQASVYRGRWNYVTEWEFKVIATLTPKLIDDAALEKLHVPGFVVAQYKSRYKYKLAEFVPNAIPT